MSRPLLRVKIDVTKIVKAAMFTGKEKDGKRPVYLDIAVWDSPKTFGNGDSSDGYVTQEISKANREAGMKGGILGNWKYLDAPKAVEQPAPRKLPPVRPAPPADPDLDGEDSAPF